MRDSSSSFAWPNRTLCSVLDGMRDAVKTLNFSFIPGAIEEAQFLANRMEAALGDQKDIMALKELRSKLRHEVRELEIEVKNLRKAAGKPEKREK
jgi:hypothetical protein